MSIRYLNSSNFNGWQVDTEARGKWVEGMRIYSSLEEARERAERCGDLGLHWRIVRVSVNRELVECCEPLQKKQSKP